MRITANSIKTENIILMILCAMVVPIARVLERYAAQSADSAAWVSPLIAAALFAPYATVLIVLIKKHPGMSLSDINEAVFGKNIGKIVNTAFALWFLMLSGYYLCQFAERMATTVYSNTNSAIFVTLMLIVASYSLKRGQETLIRASTLFFYAVISVFVLSLILLVPSVNTEYHLPVTGGLLSGAFSGAVQMFSALTYFVTFPVFLSDVKEGGISKPLIVGGYTAVLLMLFTTFVIVGIFSAPAAAQMPFPFFSAVKEISLFDSVERIEAIILCIMMLGDFTIVVLFILCCGKTVKSAYRLKDKVNYDLFLLAAFTLSLIFSFNSMRLNEISESVIVPVNLAVGAGLPVIALIVYAVKRMIKK